MFHQQNKKLSLSGLTELPDDFVCDIAIYAEDNTLSTVI